MRNFACPRCWLRVGYWVISFAKGQGFKMKTRFCPSPTGYIHLGNARTALFNYLHAHAEQGTFLFRVEDTDQERFKPEYDEALQADMRWLGLFWDEGPGQPLHDQGPYYQSQRQAVYDDYYQRLESAGFVYPCFCSEEQLALMRKIQRSSGKPPRYTGLCRSLTQQEIEDKLAHGLQPTLRFRVEDHQEVVFHDIVRGEQRFKTNDIGDFIIRRGNGAPSFMFCNALDDALMGVTHAMRGEDHLTNTPRQVLILRALGLSVPTYGHISLIVGADGSPLSKRHGSRSIRELRNSGFLAAALNNYMARLGHYYPNEAFMSLPQLAQAFKVTSLSKSPAKFNVQQLHYWQKEAVLRLTEDEFWQWVGEPIAEQVPLNKRALFVATIQANVMFPEDVAQWARICFERHDVPLLEEEKKILVEAGPIYFYTLISAYEKHGQNYQAIINTLKETLSVKGKGLFQPFRIALTGQGHGPELEKLLLLIEADVVLQRFKKIHEL